MDTVRQGGITRCDNAPLDPNMGVYKTLADALFFANLYLGAEVIVGQSSANKYIYSSGSLKKFLTSDDILYSLGTTAQRPTVAANNIPIGYLYYDTTLGLLIEHKGSDSWKDVNNAFRDGVSDDIEIAPGPNSSGARYFQILSIPRSTTSRDVSFVLKIGSFDQGSMLVLLSAGNYYKTSTDNKVLVNATLLTPFISIPTAGSGNETFRIFYQIDSATNNLNVFVKIPNYSKLEFSIASRAAFSFRTYNSITSFTESNYSECVVKNIDSSSYNTLRLGTTAQRPTVSSNNIQVGFNYYNTTTGTEQIHQGSDVWSDIATQIEGTWAVTIGAVLTAATATYSKVGKQIALSGTFTFATAATDVTITLPYAPDYGGTIIFGNLTFTLTGGSTTAKAQSSVSTTAQTFQLNYKTA